MYRLANIGDKEPLAIATAVVAVGNLLQIAGVVHLPADTVAAGNTALVLGLGLFVRAKSVPSANLDQLQTHTLEAIDLGRQLDRPAPAKRPARKRAAAAKKA
jgi:hypothetical protein